MQITQRERRTLKVGALLVVGVLFVGRVIPAWNAWERQQASVSARLAGHEVAMGATGDAERALAKELSLLQGTRELLDTLFLESTSPIAIAGTMIMLMEQATEMAGVSSASIQVTVDSSGPMSAQQVPPPRVLRSRATVGFDSDLEGLLVFLAQVEEAPPLLVVRRLTVMPLGGAASRGEAPVLRVSAVVEGVAVMRRAVGRGTTERTQCCGVSQ